MNKYDRYMELVKRRKVCNACFLKPKKKVMYNGSELNFNEGIVDTNEIGQWSAWHGDLDADIMVVGQDWGDSNYYINFKNKYVGDFETECKTNQKLRELFKCIDSDIDIYSDKCKVKLFFTNSLLCYKVGKMAEQTLNSHHSICSKLYLKELIQIIEPKIIITLGQKAFHGLISCGFHGLSDDIKKVKLKENIEQNGYKIDVNSKDIFIFPVAHAGPLGIRNRSFSSQIQDWGNIRKKALELNII